MKPCSTGSECVKRLSTTLVAGLIIGGLLVVTFSNAVHYNTLFGLGLTDQEKNDLVEYLKSI